MIKPLKLKSLTPLSRFSMVELVLALVVVIVSIVGVLGLFPVGLESNKKTMGTSFATDAGEQFLRFNASKMKTDWTWTNVFANAKPGSDESRLSWNNSPIFNAGNVYIKSTNDLNPAVDNNSGFFCLQQFTEDHVDFMAVLRVWKDLEVNSDDDSEKATLYVEVSWPASVPYDSADRQKQQFSLEVFNAPEVSVAAATYGTCSLTREHGGGFETTLGAAANTDGTYSVQLIATYDGCTDTDCLQLTEYIVESDPTYTIDYLSGDGSNDAVTGAASADVDPFDGFKVSFNNGMGGNAYTGWFKLDYTIDSLQDQRIAVKTAAGNQIVSFTVEDFEFVLDCTTAVAEEEEEGEGDTGSGAAADDAYTVDADTTLAVDTGGLSLSSNGNGNAKGVLKNDESPTGELTAVLVSGVKKGSLTLNADGSFDYTPNEGYVGMDKFVYKAFDGSKMTNVAKASINVVEVDSCLGNSAPAFADFSINDATIDSSYNAVISTDNEPTDSDDDIIALSASGLPAGLSFDAASKTFSGTPTTAGIFSITLTATDSCNNTATAQISLTVVDPCASNTPPVWPHTSCTMSDGIIAGESFTASLGSVDMPTDSDGDALTITLNNAPAWLSLNGSTLSGTPDAEGTYTVGLVATDGCATESSEVTIVVKPSSCSGNSAPVWPNASFTFDAKKIKKDRYFCWGLGSDLATDSDSTLEFTVCDAPVGQDWLYINSANQIAGVPPKAGTFTWTICASDGCNTVSTQMTLTIEGHGNTDYTVSQSGSGDLNVNPANSSGNIFELTKADGTVLDMDAMKAYFSANGNSNLSYSGGASEVKIKVKAQGRTINVDGVDVELKTNTRYTFNGDLEVNLRNTKDNPNSWGAAHGHWWISISGTGIEINGMK